MMMTIRIDGLVHVFERVPRKAQNLHIVLPVYTQRHPGTLQLDLKLM